MKRYICFIALIIIATSFLTSCRQIDAAPHVSDDFAMGTIISQQIYGNDSNSQKAGLEAFDEIRRIEDLMTINAPGGDINEINMHAGKDADINAGKDAGGNMVSIRQETMDVIKKALAVSESSGGAFDITIGPLVKLWGWSTDTDTGIATPAVPATPAIPTLPTDESIRKLLPLIDYKDIHIDDVNLACGLEKPGQIVDLGGIAKGYAADRVVSIYKENGIKSALINIGGNVAVLGSKPDNKPWSIGIQNPRANRGEYIGIVKVTDMSVVSSGDYERYFELDGERYHHIIDPKTGYPAKNDLIGVTIVSHSSAFADALSTAVFVLGMDKGMALVDKYGDTDAIFITRDKKVYVTDGLKASFEFKDRSGEYHYGEYQYAENQ